MKQTIENPNDVDWESFWAERLTGTRQPQDFTEEHIRKIIRTHYLTN